MARGPEEGPVFETTGTRNEEDGRKGDGDGCSVGEKGRGKWYSKHVATAIFEEVLGWLTIVPLVALFISAGIYPTGPYGLLFGEVLGWLTIVPLVALFISAGIYPTGPYGLLFGEVLGWLTIVPLVALFISAGIYPTGPYGLLFGVILPLKIYYYRLIAIIAFSFLLSLVCFFYVKAFGAVIIGSIWLIGAFVYLLGKRICRQARHFIEDRWQGYDDGDPNVAASLKAEGVEFLDPSADIPSLLIQPFIEWQGYDDGDPNVAASLKAEGVEFLDPSADIPSLLIQPLIKRKQLNTIAMIPISTNQSPTSINVPPSSGASSSSAAK
uniref:Yip1 domain-containing protein n=1 Tax=Ascaris lumbricoides TaxID=6252 RepID=A0A0M3IA77_ASCLU